MFAASCGAHLSSLATYPPGLPFAISILGTDQEKLVVLGLAGKEARPEVEVLELVATGKCSSPGSEALVTGTAMADKGTSPVYEALVTGTATGTATVLAGKVTSPGSVELAMATAGKGTSPECEMLVTVLAGKATSPECETLEQSADPAGSRQTEQGRRHLQASAVLHLHWLCWQQCLCAQWETLPWHSDVFESLPHPHGFLVP